MSPPYDSNEKPRLHRCSITFYCWPWHCRATIEIWASNWHPSHHGPSWQILPPVQVQSRRWRQMQMQIKSWRWRQSYGGGSERKLASTVFTTCLFFAQTVSHPITLFICAIGKDKAAAQTLVAGMTMKHVRYYRFLSFVLEYVSLSSFLSLHFSRGGGGCDDGSDGERYSGGHWCGGGYDYMTMDKMAEEEVTLEEAK